MKRIIRKNQVIITSLVIMIVVAGYLNFTADQSTTAVSDTNTKISENQAQAGEDDMLVDVTVNPEENMQDVESTAADIAAAVENETASDGKTESAASGQDSADASGESGMAVASAGEDVTAAADTAAETGSQTAEADGESIDDVGSIGEAVLTSSQAAQGFYAAAKLNREQVRSQSKEALMEVINNSEGDAAVKEEAMNSLMAINATAEKEQAAETLLEAKGYKNSVVSINEDSVDVVICLESLDDTQRAQIEDIVKRKAEVTADQIVITTLNSESE